MPATTRPPGTAAIATAAIPSISGGNTVNVNGDVNVGNKNNNKVGNNNNGNNRPGNNNNANNRPGNNNAGNNRPGNNNAVRTVRTTMRAETGLAQEATTKPLLTVVLAGIRRQPIPVRPAATSRAAMRARIPIAASRAWVVAVVAIARPLLSLRQLQKVAEPARSRRLLTVNLPFGV